MYSQLITEGLDVTHQIVGETPVLSDTQFLNAACRTRKTITDAEGMVEEALLMVNELNLLEIVLSSRDASDKIQDAAFECLRNMSAVQRRTHNYYQWIITGNVVRNSFSTFY